MSTNTAQKTPLARTMEQFAARKIGGELQLEGRSIPASVVAVVGSGVVKVKLELAGIPYVLQTLTVPVAGSEYVRLPIQKGMLGWVTSADYYLGGMSGLGGGTADLTRRPNLSNLVWSPIGNANWSAADDPDKLVLYGPDGVVIRDAGKKNTLDVNETQVTLTLTAGGFIVNLPDGQPMTVNGALVVNGALQLGGAIQGVGGGVYAGDVATSGGVTAGAGGASSVTLQHHTHPANGQPPTPGT